MSTIRKKGEGSVLQLPNGMYRAELKFTDKLGNKVTLRSKSVPSKAKAEAERKKLKAQRANYNPKTRTISEYTLNKYFEEKFLKYKADLKSSSYNRIVSTFNTHIKPNTGMLTMDKFTDEIIMEQIERLKDKGYSFSTVKKVYDLYKSIFNYAVDIRADLEINPVKSVKMVPQRQFEKPKEIAWMNKEEVKTFVDAALRLKANGRLYYKYGAVFVFLLNTGLRVSELCALKKSDFNFKNKTLKINKGLAIIRDKNTNKYKTVIQTTKTANSERYVPLNNEAIKYASIIFEMFEDNELFIYNGTGSYVRPDTLSKQLNNILDSVKLGRRGIHTLRHTFVSALFESGVDTLTIAEIIGDTEETVKRTYLHIFKERKSAAVDGINIY